MSIRKRKTADPKPLYSVEQKVFTITYHKGRPEEIAQVRIYAVKSRKVSDKDDLGKTVGTKIDFSYSLQFPDRLAEDRYETVLYPNFQKAAEAFAKAFLTIFK